MIITPNLEPEVMRRLDLTHPFNDGSPNMYAFGLEGRRGSALTGCTRRPAASKRKCYMGDQEVPEIPCCRAYSTIWARFDSPSFSLI